MPFTNETDAITYVFQSIAKSNWKDRDLDEHSRDIRPTETLLSTAGLTERKCEYVVVTGSKGKGSISAITAKLLQSLGHTVGLVTSPHLTTYRQRFRINGKMISEADLVRLINELEPHIDAVQTQLEPGKYLSPQGIFLAMAQKWFAENNVNVAVIEVGRGGRFDDNSLVPNKLSLFGPIIVEHARYMGSSIERIAWHKAGIIKEGGVAYSLPQSSSVIDVLYEEADEKQAQLTVLDEADMGKYIGPAKDGMCVDFRYFGKISLPMLGSYEIENASLALRAAANLHARLDSEFNIDSTEYKIRIRQGLEHVFWPGRCHKLQDGPAVYVDGAINVMSAKLFIESVRDRLTSPVIVVLAVPKDRDYKAVYPLFASIADAVVLTETARNITISFPDQETVTQTARLHYDDVTYRPNIREALNIAIEKAGSSGSVVMSIAQPAVGDLMEVYGLDFEII
jgi:dihydrofolate synthase / folylpolyglutamate synthase